MKQYLDLCRNILANGELKTPARQNMPATIELFKQDITCNLYKGFPLLTTKKVSLKNIITELFWFLSGSTDVRYLASRGCNIWNEDVYRFVKKEQGETVTPKYKQWVELCKNKSYSDDENAITGCFGNFEHIFNGGEIYGHHWRNFNNNTDQILNLVNGLIKDPDSRYHIVTAWNPTVIANKKACLPSCHVLFQCSVSKSKYLDLFIYQRSCDIPLGVPYNIASYALLIHILCELTGYEPGTLSWTGGSVHIYENQISTMEEQLENIPSKLPKLCCELISDIDIKNAKQQGTYTNEMLNSLFVPELWNIHLKDYHPNTTITYPFSSGKEPYIKTAILMQEERLSSNDDCEFNYENNVDYWFNTNKKQTLKYIGNKKNILLTDENTYKLLPDDFKNEMVFVSNKETDIEHFIKTIQEHKFAINKVIYIIGDFDLYNKAISKNIVDVIYGNKKFILADKNKSYKKGITLYNEGQFYSDRNNFEFIWKGINYCTKDGNMFDFILHNKKLIETYKK